MDKFGVGLVYVGMGEKWREGEEEEKRAGLTDDGENGNSV